MAKKFDDIPSGVPRFSDMKFEPEEMLPPIRGFDDKPVPLSLEEAVKPLVSIVPDLDHMVWTVKNKINQPKDGLSKDESASIKLYTLEWGPPERPFYAILNENLRSKNRHKLIPWFLYLRLFIHALSKLLRCSHRVVYRGIKMDLTKDYCVGNDVFWWAFSSCTSLMNVLENYIGTAGKRTIFNITFESAKDISQHSCFPEEKEVLFYPARQFKVTSSLHPGNDLHIIQLEETEPRYALIRMPPEGKSNPSPLPTDQFINILCIGEKNVGKSTFINAFVNYLRFTTVEQAQSNEPIVLKPLSFVMTINDNFETRTVAFGNFDHRDQSITERCQTYTFDLNQTDGKKLCLIDTPSLEDTHDSNKIKHILEYVNNLTHLNAVCFILKPEVSKLSDSFQSCFSQLLNRLGINARKNVIFCFTNTLMAFSTPGNTASSLRQMFASCSMNDIPFSKLNTFCFDNESFRYLVAVLNGIRFNSEDREEYTMSWSESVKESKRLLDYIRRGLTPYRIIKK